MFPTLLITAWAETHTAGDSWASITIRTCWISGCAVAAALALGIPAGWLLGRAKSLWADIALLAIRSAMAMPPVVLGLLLLMLLARSGPLGHWQWLFTPKAMILAQLLLILPFPISILAEAVRSLPANLEKQLLGLGATKWQACVWSLRQLGPALALAVGASIGRSLSEVGAILIVGGNLVGRTRVLTTAVVSETGAGDYRSALSLGLTLLVMALIANFLTIAATFRRHSHAE